jgi:hypothetical protein
MRRWAHDGAHLTNWRVAEVADLLYGAPGMPTNRSADGGCPWNALQRVTKAVPELRAETVTELLAVPIVRELECLCGQALEALEDAAGGQGDWAAAVNGAWRALFPGAHRVG